MNLLENINYQNLCDIILNTQWETVLQETNVEQEIKNHVLRIECLSKQRNTPKIWNSKIYEKYKHKLTGLKELSNKDYSKKQISAKSYSVTMWKTVNDINKVIKSVDIKLIKTQKSEMLTSKNSVAEFFNTAFATREFCRKIENNKSKIPTHEHKCCFLHRWLQLMPLRHIGYKLHWEIALNTVRVQSLLNINDKYTFTDQ